MVSGRTSQRTFFGVSALLFAASATAAIVWCQSMSTMGDERVARAIGAIGIAAGLFLIGRTLGLG